MEKDPSIGSGCWYLGGIYCNPDDSRIIVSKKARSMGWTVNFTRPMAIPVLLLTMAYVLAPTYLLLHFGVESAWAFVAANIMMFIGLMAFCTWMASCTSSS